MLPTGARLRIGTRGSRLALAQANATRDLLLGLHPELDIEIITIRTSGDKGNREQLGAFVHEIQQSLLAEEIDVALHCLKDLPTSPVPGLRLSAHLKRVNPHDAFISRVSTLADLPKGAIVGTGSLRRTSQLAGRRPDLSFKPLLGNVDTRLRKLMEGEYDAIVLAIAGLARLDLLEDWPPAEYKGLSVRTLTSEEMLPAPGQGVLVLETREGDSAAHDVARSLNDPATAVCAEAERAFLATFGGGCSVPVGALATISGPILSLEGRVTSPDGRRSIKGTLSGPADENSLVGRRLAERIGKQGAFDIVRAAARAAGRPHAAPA